MLLFALFLAALDLAPEFAKDEVWTRSPANYSVYAKHGQFVWRDFKVWDLRMVPGGRGIERVEMSLYNRGDDQGAGMTMAEFKTLAAKIFPNLEISRVPKRKVKSGAYQYEYSDPKAKPPMELGWGVDGDQVEYVRLAILDPNAPKARKVQGQAAKAKVAANVRREESGDVWIEGIPMVNQGEKGYCAVATCERVLRYYGSTVDEHELAQMAGTSAKEGTSLKAMKAVASEISAKYRLGYNDIFAMGWDVRALEKEVEAYNKAAKSMKRAQIDLSRYYVGGMVMGNRALEAMEPEVILKMRTKDARFAKFKKDVKARIDQGIPVCWSVRLGIFPEPDIPQASGGHMRLIIGYNQKTGELIYSDSWGRGHEKKRMDAGKAFAVTTSAFALKPL